MKILLEGAAGLTATGDTATARSTLLAKNSPVFERLVQEASLMTQIHSPYIVQFLGMTTEPAALVTEYCSRGSLNQVLQAALQSEEYAKDLTWNLRVSLAADATRGMLYLHNRSPPILHRDLKSANLLVTRSWTAKVADFNLSRVLEETNAASNVMATNPRWLR